MKFILTTFLFLTLINIGYAQNDFAQTISLSNNWKFRKAGDKAWLPATVPGCVHTDLSDNKKIVDPFIGKNELTIKWIENEDWEYTTTFNIDAATVSFSNIDLQLDGLDTYADVYLNETLVLKADNMFIDWTIPAKKFLKQGQNKLRIYFHSAVTVGMEKLRKVPYTLMAANEIAPENERSNVFTRKAPFHYGWDWGPRLVTCGVWKPIKIKAWNTLKLDDLYVKPMEINSNKASYKAIVEIAADQSLSARMEVFVDNKKTATNTAISLQSGINTVDVDFVINNPSLWWTNGLGTHKLYTIEVKLFTGEKLVQTISKRIGVRTIELVQEKDSIGSSFTFKLNGIPVFMKGANYIPSDIFTTRNTIGGYKTVVKNAIDANMNMLRIWGGAIYENDELYDMMDENGLLAWNDFMFACNLQPNDSMHLDNIRKEAEYNVKRLRNHPSTALWCGNNENLRAWYNWGWNIKYSPEVADTLWQVYEKIFYNILPDAVKKYHPEIYYWPSSPQAAGNKISNRISGDEHDWTVWFGDVPFTSYSTDVPRFVSEYGLQSFPEMKTIKSFAGDSDLAYRSTIMEHRQRSLMPWIGENFNGNEMIKTYIARYYKVPENFKQFAYVSQLMQAEGVKYAIETHRSNMPRCMGSLYWQINDCWPTMSWSSVDYFGRWKALHYAIKKAFQPIYPIIDTVGNDINISVASDKLNDTKSDILIRLYTFSGKVIWQKEINATIAANTSKLYLSIPKDTLLAENDGSQSVLEVTVKTGAEMIASNLYYLKEYKALQLQKPIITKTIKKLNANKYELTLKTNTLAKNVAFFTKKTEGFFSDNYFDMLPGKTYRITFTGAAADLKDELEVMCLNEAYN